MSGTQIKICGIKDPKHAKAAAKAGATYVGVVFVEKSPRHVTIKQAAGIVEALPGKAEAVGLFVDRDVQEIKHIVGRVGLTTIQLHGHEKISILDRFEGLTIWKALPFGPDLLEIAEPWDNDPRIDAILIDTPTTGELTGGSGVAFDWAALAKVVDKLTTPIILAGGLTPQSVGEAIKIVKPFAVDVSSGVESSRGEKDVGLIKAFCQAVRQADA